MKKKKILLIILIILACFTVIGIASVFGVNAYVKYIGGKNIIKPEDAAELKDMDCIVVLGCQVRCCSQNYYEWRSWSDRV